VLQCALGCVVQPVPEKTRLEMVIRMYNDMFDGCHRSIFNSLFEKRPNTRHQSHTLYNVNRIYNVDHPYVHNKIQYSTPKQGGLVVFVVRADSCPKTYKIGATARFAVVLQHRKGHVFDKPTTIC